MLRGIGKRGREAWVGKEGEGKGELMVKRGIGGDKGRLMKGTREGKGKGHGVTNG